MDTKKEKLSKIKELIEKREAEISNKQVLALTKKIDELIVAIKEKPATQIITQVPPSIHVENFEKAPDRVSVSKIDDEVKVSGAVDVKNFPDKFNVDLKQPLWAKELQQDLRKKADKPTWIDGIVADLMGLLAALMARVASGTVEAISTLISGLWRAGIRVRFDGVQEVVIIDQKSGKPIGRGEFGGGGGGSVGGGGASKAVKLSLDQYKISDMDDAASPKYYGFVEKDGAWYITKEDTSAKTYRYCRGSSDYSTAWTDRASQTYDYFDKVF